MPRQEPGFSEAILAILGLCTISIALPLFNTLAGGISFFIAHKASATDIVLFALIIFLIPAIVCCIALGLVRVVHTGLGRLFLYFILAVLVGLWIAGLLRQLTSIEVLAIVIVGAAATVFGLSRYPQFLSFLRMLGLISPLVPLGFLFLSPVNGLLRDEKPLESNQKQISTTPVVMVVLDELSLVSMLDSNGNVDSGRLPNFGRLAQLSTWYSNTTTVSGLTDRAVPALLSGLKVSGGTAPLYRQFPQNLFTVLAPSHRVSAVETITRLCPPSVCTTDTSHDAKTAQEQVAEPVQMYNDATIVYLHTLLPESLAAAYLPEISGRWRGFRNSRDVTTDASTKAPQKLSHVGDMVRNRALRFKKFSQQAAHIEHHSARYFHLALPHYPWLHLPDGTIYNGSEIPGRSKTEFAWETDQYLVEQGQWRYAMQVEYL
ncbi:MAG: hypothetical protein ACR2PS_02160, partial [Pseudomonadales bacterium]